MNNVLCFVYFVVSSSVCAHGVHSSNMFSETTLLKMIYNATSYQYKITIYFLVVENEFKWPRIETNET